MHRSQKVRVASWLSTHPMTTREVAIGLQTTKAAAREVMRKVDAKPFGQLYRPGRTQPETMYIVK